MLASDGEVSEHLYMDAKRLEGSRTKISQLNPLNAIDTSTAVLTKDANAKAGKINWN